MNHYTIIEYGKLNDLQREELTDIFIKGFGHLFTFTKEKDTLKTLFLSAFHPLYTYAYVEDGTVLGMVGVRPIKLSRDVCVDLFGKWRGTMIYKQINGIFQSQVVKGNEDLYIDVLGTAKDARGKGIGTKLINFSFELPNYNNYYIEVLSKNSNAQRLYEKRGFVMYKKNRFSPIALMGYGYSIKMKK